MTKRRWRKQRPNSMQEAIRLCLSYAEYRTNANAKRIGDLVGVTEWTIYGWMKDGSIPSKRIPPFEMACGAYFVTEYLANAAQKLLVDIPRGRSVSQDDLLQLQGVMNDAVSRLAAFYKGDAEANAALGAIGEAMTALAGHRENVIKHDAPELALFERGQA